jgi:hypothetical protein
VQRLVVIIQFSWLQNQQKHLGLRSVSASTLGVR